VPEQAFFLCGGLEDLERNRKRLEGKGDDDDDKDNDGKDG